MRKDICMQGILVIVVKWLPILYIVIDFPGGKRNLKMNMSPAHAIFWYGNLSMSTRKSQKLRRIYLKMI